jgi:hypothetical protein
VNFWAAAPHVPALARLERLNRRRNRSNLIAAYRGLVPAERAPDLADELAATLDGYWVQRAQSDCTLTPERARRMMKAQIRKDIARIC